MNYIQHSTVVDGEDEYFVPNLWTYARTQTLAFIMMLFMTQPIPGIYEELLNNLFYDTADKYQNEENEVLYIKSDNIYFDSFKFIANRGYNIPDYVNIVNKFSDKYCNTSDSTDIRGMFFFDTTFINNDKIIYKMPPIYGINSNLYKELKKIHPHTYDKVKLLLGMDKI